MLEWSLFGDPTLAAEDGDDPITMPVYRSAPSGFIAKLLDNFPLISRFLEMI
jgi:hypothetical protein